MTNMSIQDECGLMLVFLLVAGVQTENSTWPEMPIIKFCMGDEKKACPNSIMKWIYNKKDCVRAKGKNCEEDYPNMFQSRSECQNFCHGARCFLAPADFVSGPCKKKGTKSRTVWVFYKSRCIKWNYSGCGGTTNHFKSGKMCAYHCLNPKYNDAMPKA